MTNRGCFRDNFVHGSLKYQTDTHSNFLNNTNSIQHMHNILHLYRYCISTAASCSLAFIRKDAMLPERLVSGPINPK